MIIKNKEHPAKPQNNQNTYTPPRKPVARKLDKVEAKQTMNNPNFYFHSMSKQQKIFEIDEGLISPVERLTQHQRIFDENDDIDDNSLIGSGGP